MENKADIYRPVYSDRVGPPPLVIRAVVTATADYMVGGMPSSSLKAEDYVLVSALPKEIQDRVRTAVQALIAGM